MDRGQILYVRTDYKIDGITSQKKDFDDHIEYLNKVSKERFFMGGGFVSSPGRMIIYEAANIDDAKRIASGDPLIERGLYRYEIHEWEMVILSKELKD